MSQDNPVVIRSAVSPQRQQWVVAGFVVAEPSSGAIAAIPIPADAYGNIAFRDSQVYLGTETMAKAKSGATDGVSTLQLFGTVTIPLLALILGAGAAYFNLESKVEAVRTEAKADSQRFSDKVDARFDKIEARFDKIDDRFDKLGEKLDRLSPAKKT